MLPLVSSKEKKLLTRLYTASSPIPAKESCCWLGHLVIRCVSCLKADTLAPIFLFALLAGFVLGCDRTETAVEKSLGTSEAPAKFVQGKLSPTATIRECIAAYQRLGSYQDAATVELRYRLNGQVHADSAPLSIAWQKHGPVGMKVYSVQAGPDLQSGDSKWNLRIERAGFSAPNQVISRTVPAKVDFAWLLDDPLVAQHIAAGLAGFPPQLDMLLSPQPMRQLVNESAELEFGPTQTIEGRSCSVVNISQGKLTFRLFIDRATMLLRRIRLPSGNLPPEILEHEDVTDIELWIDLKDVQADRSPRWSDFAVEARPDELRVNHFVPVPPQMEIAGLGRKVPAFHLEDANGTTIYSSRNRTTSNRATVLLWLADHPACRVAAEQLAQAAAAIRSNPEYELKVDFVPVWAEPDPPQGETFTSMRSEWSLPGDVALDRAALGRDLFDVQEAPSLVVLDHENKIQIRETSANPLLGQVLPELLARICEGDDLAAELLDQDRHTDLRFATELKTAMTPGSPALPEGLQLHGPYPPEVFTLGESNVESVGKPIQSMTVDVEDRLWTLHEGGALSCREVSATGVRSIAEYQTDWNFVSDPGSRESQAIPRLFIDEQKRFAACSLRGDARIALMDLKSKHSTTILLQQDARVHDLAWMPLNNQPSRLAVITNEQSVVLIDPRNQEQLSGKCPSVPLAVLPYQASSAEVDGRVVLSDRSVQTLELAADSTAHSVPTLGRPAAFRIDGGVGAASRSLDFHPASGPWNWIRSKREASAGDDADARPILAAGWLAQDEPAVFMLDQELRPLWHYRVPIQREQTQLALTDSAIDPSTSQPVWIKVDQDQTLHLLRRDGLTDHFRFDEPVHGVGLVPSGDALLFCVAHRDRLVVRPIRWK